MGVGRVLRHGFKIQICNIIEAERKAWGALAPVGFLLMDLQLVFGAVVAT